MNGSAPFAAVPRDTFVNAPMRSMLGRVLGSGALSLLVVASVEGAIDTGWLQLSSRRAEIPIPPGGSTQQTGALVGDFDGDGLNDFILSFRQKPPALVWYRRTATGWTPQVIEKDYLTVEAGGAQADIDRDGDPDVVFGGDWQSREVWWWENPAPDFDPGTSWKRRVIKSGGAAQHHDQVFADFLGTGSPQLAFWNQQAKTLYLAEIPADPRSGTPWPLTEVVSGTSAGSTPYTEGMSAEDIDGDGLLDLLAYNAWYKHLGDRRFKAIPLTREGGLIFAGWFKPSKHPQIVISPGDGEGTVRWFECVGNPENPEDWQSHTLLDRKVVHGHSLQLGDVNRDGHLDIFLAEMAKWREREPGRDHPEAGAWIFYGDGQGNFARRELIVGHGWHEARLADLDGDGDLDLLNKPYTWDAPRLDVWLNQGTRAGARGVGTSGSFRGPVGLQLYSLREVFAGNVPLAIQMARGFGFREVELAGPYGWKPERWREALAHVGLRPVSWIVDYQVLDRAIESVAAEARALGVSFVGTAGIPHEAPFTEAAARKAAQDFNRFGEALARHGLRFFYHNHGFEFVPHGDATLFDLIVRGTHPEFVTFEMDVFWTVHPGQNPVELLRRYPDRWSLMHVKDLRRGVTTGKLTGTEDVRNDVPLGSGQIDLPTVLRTAQEIGVKHYFIEDESPAVLDQLPQSLRYLESLAW